MKEGKDPSITPKAIRHLYILCGNKGREWGWKTERVEIIG
jgi:hypothetical protein